MNTMIEYMCKQCGKPFDEWSGRCLASDGSKTICRSCYLNGKDRPPYHICLMCEVKKSFHFFELRYRGYRVETFRMICEDCFPTFKRLPTIEAMAFIRLACIRYYGEKHFIYTLEESDTAITRYVGRTKYPTRRKQQHLHHAHDETHAEAMQRYHALPEEIRAGVAPPLYQEGYWGRDLIDRGAYPVFKLVEEVADGPLGAEREVRWMLHLIQQGTSLLNSPAFDEGLVEYAKTSQMNFLTDNLSLETLHALGRELLNGAQHMAFIRLYYLGEIFSHPDWREEPLVQRLFPRQASRKQLVSLPIQGLGPLPLVHI